MTFRRKLLAIFALTVFVSVGAVAWLVLALTRNAFAKTEDQRTAALIAQFQREFKRRGDEVAERTEAIAKSDAVSRMATALSGSSSSGTADSADYFELAKSMAESHQLDFLEFLDGHGAIISSAQWPAKFGYPETAFESLSASSGQGAFLKREESAGFQRVRTLCRADNRSERPSCICDWRATTRQEFSFRAGFAGGHARSAVSESR